jgi:hypothetical protein
MGPSFFLALSRASAMAGQRPLAGVREDLANVRKRDSVIEEARDDRGHEAFPGRRRCREA